MGLFDSIKGVANFVKDAREENRKNYLNNKERRSVRDIEYTTLSPSVAEVVEKGKKGLFGGKDKQRFIDCIKEGRASYAEVYGVSHKSVEELSGVDSRATVRYVKVATLDGVVLQEGVHVYDDEHLDFDDDREPEDAWMKEDYVAPESNPDVVDTKGRMKLYILHYYLGKYEQYVVLKPAEFKDLSKIVKNIFCPYDCLDEGTGFVWGK